MRRIPVLPFPPTEKGDEFHNIIVWQARVLKKILRSGMSQSGKRRVLGGALERRMWHPADIRLMKMRSLTCSQRRRFAIAGPTVVINLGMQVFPSDMVGFLNNRLPMS